MASPGQIILLALPQADGVLKNRPALVLCRLPGHGDFLVCGISSRLHQCLEGFDEIVAESDPDYDASGLIKPSVIRLGFLAAIPGNAVRGVIGTVAAERLRRLLDRLSRHLAEGSFKA